MCARAATFPFVLLLSTENVKESVTRAYYKLTREPLEVRERHNVPSHVHSLTEVVTPFASGRTRVSFKNGLQAPVGSDLALRPLVPL